MRGTGVESRIQPIRGTEPRHQLDVSRLRDGVDGTAAHATVRAEHGDADGP